MSDQRKRPAREVEQGPPPRTRVERSPDGELTWRGDEDSLSAKELVKSRERRHDQWIRSRALAALGWWNISAAVLSVAAGVGVMAGGLSEDFALKALGISVGGSLSALCLVLRWAFPRR